MIAFPPAAGVPRGLALFLRTAPLLRVHGDVRWNQFPRIRLRRRDLLRV